MKKEQMVGARLSSELVREVSLKVLEVVLGWHLSGAGIVQTWVASNCRIPSSSAQLNGSRGPTLAHSNSASPSLSAVTGPQPTKRGATGMIRPEGRRTRKLRGVDRRRETACQVSLA